MVYLFRLHRSDRNLLFHPVHCPISLHLCREFGKGIKMVRGLGYCIMVMKHSACNKYYIRALCPFLDFLAGISQKETRGSPLEARKIEHLQQAITWCKIRHAGGQVHYYSHTGTLEQRPVKLDRLKTLCFNVPVWE